MENVFTSMGFFEISALHSFLCTFPHGTLPALFPHQTVLTAQQFRGTDCQVSQLGFPSSDPLCELAELCLQSEDTERTHPKAFTKRIK